MADGSLQANSRIARYLVDNVGTDLYQLHNEIEKLRTYVGEARPIEPRDIDVLILRSEQYGPFELDDAVLASDYKKAVQVSATMLDEGVEPLIILARIVAGMAAAVRRKALAGKRSAKDVAAAAMVPAGKRQISRLLQKIRLEAARGRISTVAICGPGVQDIHAESRRIFRRDAVENDRVETADHPNHKDCNPLSAQFAA